jgi:hypothetical protein
MSGGLKMVFVGIEMVCARVGVWWRFAFLKICSGLEMGC